MRRVDSPVWNVHNGATGCCAPLEDRPDYSFTPRNRNALAITDTELKLIAALAIFGLNNHPKNG
jgi:hypothetical protein